jgi:hypothetical protein
MNKQELTEKLLENHRKFADFAIGLSETDFMFAPENKWTAGQQIDHILRGVSPVTTVLALPKFVPNLLFGKANRDSIDYETLVKNYQSKLAAGSKASGRFIPPEIGFEKRKVLRDKLLKTVAELTERIEKFTEAQLDGYVLPHPILGKLTIREMLYFTIYHVEHHHKSAAKNLESK